jgi:hypothetical protein
MVNQEILQMLAVSGIKYVPRINDTLLEADDLRALDDKKLTVSVIMYAAALANMTKLDLEDFLSIAVYAYQNVTTEKSDEEAIQNRQDSDPTPESDS